MRDIIQYRPDMATAAAGTEEEEAAANLMNTNERGEGGRVFGRLPFSLLRTAPSLLAELLTLLPPLASITPLSGYNVAA